jgi:hypothetical protein
MKKILKDFINYNWCSNFISYYYYWITLALEENRPVDESVILMKMSVTGWSYCYIGGKIKRL